MTQRHRCGAARASRYIRGVRLNILLCDDHRMMRDGLRAILEKSGLRVVGEASNGREALGLSEELRPDLVVMDISMPELNGIDATRLLLHRRPNTKVIGLSISMDQRYVEALFAAGAVAYLLKTAAAEELIQAVHAVAAGSKYVTPAVAGSAEDYWAQRESAKRREAGPVPSPSPSQRLSTREREVLQLLAEGQSTKDIAARLAIAPTTVETHRRNIMDRLKLRGIAALTRYAMREGITSIE
jgi:two-component system, NarL family, response regulator LiaR